MKLSSELISEFVKVTNDEPEKKNETTVYATAISGDTVQIDGSDTTIPVTNQSSTKMRYGDRVTVMIKNHTAIVTGNLSDASGVSNDFGDLSNQVNGENGLAEKVEKLGDLSAIEADIVNLKANKASIEQLDAVVLRTTTLESSVAEINVLAADLLAADQAIIEDLSVERGRIDELVAEDGRIANLEANKANISDLTTAFARISELEAFHITTAYLESTYLTADEIETTYLTAAQIAAEYAKINTLDSNYAQINLANVSKASIGTLLANIGLITQATIVDGHVTGYLDSVDINANDITAGTLTVDRLVISGTDKSIIYALNNTGDLTSTEVNTINGDVITKRTIAADHIIAGAITANELHSSSVTTDKIAANAVTAGKISVTSLESIVAKIGSFSINNALYTNNHSAYNSAVDGVYVGSDYISLGNGGKTWLKNDGSVSIGNDTIKYDAVKQELDITANTIKIGSEAVATTLETEEAMSSAELANERVTEIESLIEVLSESISMLVTDGSGASLMKQTEDGWTFSTGDIQNLANTTSENLDLLTKEVDDVENTIDILQQTIDDLGTVAEHVKISTYENEPCIELGESDSDFKLRITNTRMVFTEGPSVLAYFNNQSLYIKKTVVEDELQQGGFVWKIRSNGNLGLTWKGGNN